MISIQQCCRYQRALNEAQITTLKVLQKLISKSLLSFHLCDDRPNLDAEVSAGLETPPPVDQTVAITFERTDEDRDSLSVPLDRRFQSFDFKLQAIIKAANCFDMIGFDLEYAPTQPPPLEGIWCVSKGLQRQPELRLSCHFVPTCSG